MIWRAFRHYTSMAVFNQSGGDKAPTQSVHRKPSGTTTYPQRLYSVGASWETRRRVQLCTAVFWTDAILGEREQWTGTYRRKMMQQTIARPSMLMDLQGVNVREHTNRNAWIQRIHSLIKSREQYRQWGEHVRIGKNCRKYRPVHLARHHLTAVFVRVPCC